MNNVRQRPLSLGSLRAFEAVARRLSFSDAADELHLTQSAVSRQIKGLEDELGAPLFTRGTRHVELTARGSATDRLVDMEEPDLDLVLRYCSPNAAPEGAQRMFGEVMTPVIGVRLAERIQRGEAPPLATPADLAGHTLAEEDDHRPSAQY